MKGINNFLGILWATVIRNDNFNILVCLIYSTAFLGKIKTINLVLGGYRIHGANNHASAEVTNEQINKALLGVEMTNQYINEFLENINYPHRVDLSRNLQLRRE
ncbi:MAG: hypothetical protein AAFX80_20695, partial [Cyanobacteria bacterium J06639_18]